MTELFLGGGTIANTLNAVPEAIDKMLKEYNIKNEKSSANQKVNISRK